MNGRLTTHLRTRTACHTVDILSVVAVIYPLKQATLLITFPLRKDPFKKGSISEATIKAGSKAGDKIALRTTFNGFQQGTCYIYEWKQVE